MNLSKCLLFLSHRTHVIFSFPSLFYSRPLGDSAIRGPYFQWEFTSGLNSCFIRVIWAPVLVKLRAETREFLPTEGRPFRPQWCMFSQRKEIQSIWLHAQNDGFPTVVIIQAPSVLSFSGLIINSPLMCLWHRKPQVSAWEKIEREQAKEKNSWI